MTPRSARRHEEAVIAAEVRRLARALAPYRELQRDALRRTAGASSWREGTDIAGTGGAQIALKPPAPGVDFG
jgi:hypothetical protein